MRNADGGIEVKQPTLTYKATFFLGSAGFAVFSYLIGTIVYEAENLWTTNLAATLDAGGAIKHIFPNHLVTFVPWVIGTTLLGIALGYLFDRQIQYRRVAEELQRKSQLQAVVDGLTQCYNRSYMFEQLGLEIKRSTNQFVGQFALLLLDLDDFKKYNDTHGHLVGDEALRRVARVIRSSVRETDVVARYGGEEFIVLAAGADEVSAKTIAERIRMNIQETCPTTVSIGLAYFPEDGASAEELVEKADARMYKAKALGKNLVAAA